MPAADSDCRGFLFVGDPHLSSRPVEYRKDDYGRAVLGKLDWALRHAKNQRLQPVILGDLFHYPRDNANWLIVELMRLFADRAVGAPVLAVYGNHDSKENALGDGDTMTVLVESGHVALLRPDEPWRASIGGVPVCVGGSAWSERLPERVERPLGGLVFWVAHHNAGFRGYDAKRFDCHEIPGVDVVVNGHIHRRLPEVVVGGTTWINPGALARVARGDATRDHRPTVLEVEITPEGWTRAHVEVPCAPYEQVFHALAPGEDMDEPESYFVSGLRELESIRTAGGAALREFLAHNLAQFEAPVREAILALAEEELNHD
jgi:predicted phosphodiesterase